LPQLHPLLVLAFQAPVYAAKMASGGGADRSDGGRLFAGEAGMALPQRVDRRVDRMPGLGGLHLLEGAARPSPNAA
jgi:hypothetical protein